MRFYEFVDDSSNMISLGAAVADIGKVVDLEGEQLIRDFQIGVLTDRGFRILVNVGRPWRRRDFVVGEAGRGKSYRLISPTL